jgi:hypothetical protein
MVSGDGSKRQRDGAPSEQSKADSANILHGFIECVEARRSAREQKIPPAVSDVRRVEEPG